MRLVLAARRSADDVVLQWESGEDFVTEADELLLLEESGSGETSLEFVEPGVDGPYPWLVKVDTLLLAARAGHLEGVGVGETANMRVELDNSDRQASALIGHAPRMRAWVYDDDDELYFAGLIQRIDYAHPLVLNLEAGLTDPLPLRSTRMLGDYAEDLPLPVIIGDWTESQFPLIRLSPTRYFAADHPMEITKAFTAKQQTAGWERALESDDAGRTWTVVIFAAPVPQDVAVSASGRGILDATTGALIENPGDAFALITNTLGGRDDDWSRLRAQASHLKVKGRLAERKAIKLWLDDVAQSVGAIWWHGDALLYPATDDSDPILDLDKSEIKVGTLKASASLTDTADVLRLAYDQSDASNRAQHYIELSASPQRYGGLSKEVVYGWLRNPDNAEAVGRPVLQRLAGERYDVEFLSSNMSLRPGMKVRPVAHPEWMIPGDDPIVRILQVELDRDNHSVDVRGETVIGEAVITVTAHSLALPDTVAASIDVSVRNGVATFGIEDEDKRPIANARVALDGGAPKTTDAQGKVAFAVTAGVHELAVEAAGYVPFTLQITL